MLAACRIFNYTTKLQGGSLCRNLGHLVSAYLFVDAVRRSRHACCASLISSSVSLNSKSIAWLAESATGGDGRPNLRHYSSQIPLSGIFLSADGVAA